jgi:hypothetical protein
MHFQVQPNYRDLKGEFHNYSWPGAKWLRLGGVVGVGRFGFDF